MLSFATKPLQEDVEIAGPIVVKLWVSTDGPDTDFTAKLIDMYPPASSYPEGCALNLTDSIARLRFRNGYERDELATPGEVYELEFELYPTANRFVKGHRIRVDISSSNFPRFEVNSNTGGPLGRDRGMRTAQNSVCHGALRRAYLRFPLHPLGVLMAVTGPGINAWGPLSVVVLIKSAVMRIGGMRLYRRLIPLFVGIAVGDFFSAGLVWSLIASYGGEGFNRYPVVF